MKKYVVGFLFTFLSFTKLIACPVEFYTSFFYDLDEAVLAENTKFNGRIMVYSDSFPIFNRDVGYSNFETESKVDWGTQFVIGSISKQITAVLVLRELEKGNLSLQETLGDYFTEFPSVWKDSITVHHLLTHQHGIVDLSKPLKFLPGSQFEYSQYGYHLLSLILEKVTEKSFARLSQEFFDEIGMSQSFHPSLKDSAVNLSIGYEEEENGELVASPYSFENYAAAGSFISSAQDLVIWNHKLHIEGLILKPETYKLLLQSHSTRKHPFLGNLEYSYGLTFKKGQQGKMIGALGYAPGFVSLSCFFPKTGTTLVVLQNTARNLDDFRKTFYYNLRALEIVRDFDA